MTADGGGLLLLIALILGGIGVRKARSGGGSGLLLAQQRDRDRASWRCTSSPSGRWVGKPT